MALDPARDPLLQPFQLRHLTLRNRLMSTSHEPYFSEDGMPKDRYRLYHVEKAKGGIALTMTAGSAVVSPDSPPVFGNLLAYKDEIVPWMRRLADDCHAHGAAVMIQLTHLGRRTAWNKADWLPVLAPSPVREPRIAHSPRRWRTGTSSASSPTTPRRRSAWRPPDWTASRSTPTAICRTSSGRRPPTTATTSTAAAWTTGCASSAACSSAMRAATGPRFIVGVRMVADEDWEIGLSRAEGIEIARRLVAGGHGGFPQRHPRPHGHRRGADAGDPDPWACAPRRIWISPARCAPRRGFPVFHAARIQDVATARHAIAAGKLDMVGMTRAHIADPHIVRQLMAGREDEIRPCVGATYCLDRIYEGNDAVCVHNPGDRARGDDAARHRAHRGRAARKWSWSAPGPAGWKRRASPRRAAMRLCCSRRRRDPAGRCCSRAGHWRGARS